MNMNSKDRYIGENTKKKKLQNMPAAKLSNITQCYYLVNKTDLDKLDKTQKSARNISKLDPNSKNSIKSEKNIKTVNPSNQIKPFQIDQSATKAYILQLKSKQTKNNLQILAELESNFSKYENFELEKGIKRWSDIPVKPSYGTTSISNRNIVSNVNVSRLKPDNSQGLENDNTYICHEKLRGHVRNYSTSKILNNNEIIQQSSSIHTNNNVKQVSNNMKSNIQQSHTGHSQNYSIDKSDKNQTIYCPNQQDFTSLTKKFMQKKDEYEIDNCENMLFKENIFYTANLSHLNHQLGSTKQEEFMIEEVKDQVNIHGIKLDSSRLKQKEGGLAHISNKTQEEITTSITNPNALLINPSAYINGFQQNAAPSSLRSLSSNHMGSNASGIISYNIKKSTGKSTSSGNSSNNSIIKATIPKTNNPMQKYSDQKTESTYISGGDSPSAVLDCDEAIPQNLTNINRIKNDPYLWVEKFNVEVSKPISNNVETSYFAVKIPGNNEIIPDISDKVYKVEPIYSFKNIEEEIKNFHQENNANAIDTETISYMIMREPDYTPDPHYLDKKQPSITWIMRTILFDWMMEVCMEFTLKRETYHYAINYVDRYLSYIPNIQKWDLQLIGVTAMYISAKMEEIYAPKVADFAKSADNGYSTQQIMEMEQKMLKVLNWLLIPASLNTWANWYMNQWDLYIEHSPYAIKHPLILTFDEGLIQFKQPNEKSYAIYREIMQLIDCSTLEVQTLEYKQRPLIASFMYLVLGKHYRQFTNQQISDEFPNSSLYLLDNEYAFNDLFGNFLSFSFGFQLADLLPTIQYVSTYFRLNLNFDLPTAAKINKDNVLEGHFEEFLAYQTHNPLMVDFIKNRPRTIM